MKDGGDSVVKAVQEDDDEDYYGEDYYDAENAGGEPAHDFERASGDEGEEDASG